MPPARCRLTGAASGTRWQNVRRDLHVTPVLSAVYEELQTRASAPVWRDQSREACQAFLRRTSSSARAEPAPPERRVRASWDDALTEGGLAALLAPTFEDASERALARAMARAHRSTFELAAMGAHRIVRDVIAGGEFIVLPRDDIARGLFAVASEEPSLFEARIVAATDGCAIMPGILFHPPAAAPLILEIVHSREAQQLSRHALCDALLRMLHTFDTLARVKIGYAYKVEALVQPAPAGDRATGTGERQC